ncbi:MAG: alpha/beta fold hydrolase [Spirochaetaceae bacterium]|jgi:dipeptidyl aminopeptidase/acylaminoacyl peptidase|nr:alpha/beta fold hydrolase [Spirochaetaceae bacterium]
MKMVKILAALLALAVLSGCASKPEPEESLGYQETSVSLDAGTYQIPAVVTTPQGGADRAFPAIVMLHGYGSNKDEAGNGYKIAAPELAKKGIASIRIDFMGYGDSAVDHAEYTIDVGVREAGIAADYIAALPGIDPARIGILGWSKGGAIALLAAGRNPVFKSVLTWAGAPNLSGAVYSAEGYEAARQNGVYVAEFDWRGPLNLSLEAFDAAAGTDILAEFSRSAAPVLAIAGSEDTAVPPETTEQIRAASANAASRALIIPGADHTFNIFTGDMEAFNVLINETVKWFGETL